MTARTRAIRASLAWLSRNVVLQAISQTSDPPEAKFLGLSSLLSAEETQREIALIERNLWATLEKGFERGRRKARVSLAKKPAKARDQVPASVPDQDRVEISAVEIPGFEFDPDFTKVKLLDKEFLLTEPQAAVVRVLYEELQKGGSGALTRSTINTRLKSLEKPTITKMKDAFRSLEYKGRHWTELIARVGKSHYRLNVTMPEPASTPTKE